MASLSHNMFELIVKHGIACRQIPHKVIRKYRLPPGGSQRNPDSIIDGEFEVVTTIPEHAGYWLTQTTNSATATMVWSKKLNNLAPSLEESIQMLVSKL